MQVSTSLNCALNITNRSIRYWFIQSGINYIIINQKQQNFQISISNDSPGFQSYEPECNASTATTQASLLLPGTRGQKHQRGYAGTPTGGCALMNRWALIASPRPLSAPSESGQAKLLARFVVYSSLSTDSVWACMTASK